MMGFSRHLVCLFIAVVTGSCRAPSRPVPYFLNESVKQDLDRASIAILANVTGVSDRGAPSGAEGYRLIELRLSIERVIKGRVAAPAVCATYLAVNKGLNGQLPTWVEPGSTGFFFLSDSSPCLRVVNDSRAYVRAEQARLAGGSSSSEKLIAEATLPDRCAGNAYVYSSAEEVWAVTIPLVGSRAARKLLLNRHKDSSPGVGSCSCLVAASVWKVSESCLSSLPSGDGIREQAQDLARANDALNLREEQELYDDPVVWFETATGAWGMDGALLRFAGLMSHSGSSLPLGTCAVLRARRKSDLFETSLKSGLARSNAAAEAAAVAQFDRWTEGGCRADWKTMELPVIDP
jgi:hypothetical protein